jgi:biofilm PGA synthesis N-glycosyltransferase PgaC
MIDLGSYLFLIWVVSAVLDFLIIGIYYAFVIYWLRIPREDYQHTTYKPRVSILIAAYNEGAVIRQKLENLDLTTYPKDLLEVYLIDGGSSDETSKIATDIAHSLGYKLNVITESRRDGKVMSLNRGLSLCSGELVVVSDADSFLENDTLERLVSNFGDPSIGAVTGYKYPYALNANASEKVYRDLTNSFRIAESRFRSTFIFQGELAAFRKSLIDEFDTNSVDDSGTALKVLEKGFRTIEDENARVFELLPNDPKGMFQMRSRRALNLIRVCFSSLRLLKKKDSKLSLIIIFNFLLHLVVPFASLIALFLIPILFIRFPLSLILFVILGCLFVVPSTRWTLLAIYSFITSQAELLSGLLLYFKGEKLILWDPKRKSQFVTNKSS